MKLIQLAHPGSLIAVLVVTACTDPAPSSSPEDAGNNSGADGGIVEPPSPTHSSDAAAPAPTASSPHPGETDGGITSPGSGNEPDAGGSNQADAAVPPPPPAGQPRADRFFLPTPEVDSTSVPHLRIDAEGGIHATYPSFTGKGAYYAYCAPGCDATTDVQVVRFDTEMSVQGAFIDLDAEGRPRVLFNSWDRVYYAECDQSCTDRDAWELGVLIRHDNKLDVSGEAFALDANGDPHFIVHSYVELFGVGQSEHKTVYASCTTDCTLADSWTGTVLAADEIWEGSTLRFGRDGSAHLFGAEVKYELGVPKSWAPVYSRCAGGCEDATNWETLEFNAELYEDREKAVSIRPSVALELTQSDAPRLLAMLRGAGEDERVIGYFECDADCTTSETAWTGTAVSNNDQLAAGVDLALDAEDRPRIVYDLAYSVFIAECDTGTCARAPSEWQITPVELVAEMPPDQIILWPNCNVDAWFLHHPTLALSPAGKPIVAYQASDFSGGGVPNPSPHESPCQAGIDLSWSRITRL